MIISKKQISQISKGLLPFSDAATEALPLMQLLRLSLFQISAGMATVLLLGTLNRVMIVELGVKASLVAIMALDRIIINRRSVGNAFLIFGLVHFGSLVVWQ